MITLKDIVIVCVILAVLALAGLAVYAGAKVKRSKMKRVESLFEEGNFNPEEIRDAVEKDQKEHGEK
jgi:Tfp pilus assembly protein PilE